MIESRTESRLNIRVSQEFLDRLKKAADDKGLTLTAFVTTTLTEVLDGGEVVELKDEVCDLRSRLEKLEEQIGLIFIGS